MTNTNTEPWQGVARFIEDSGWLQPHRLDLTAMQQLLTRDLLNPGERNQLWFNASCGSGIHGEFDTVNCARFVGEFRVAYSDRPGAVSAARPPRLDILADGTRIARVPLSDGDTHVSVGLPDGTRRVSVWLDTRVTCWFRNVGCEPAQSTTLASTYGPADLSREPRWLVYGSSITQCAEVDGPSETWPAIVARELGLNLHSLGLDGDCHLDPELEQALCASQADLITLCLGINIYGSGSFGSRSLRGQLHRFMASVQAANPQAQIIVQTPIAAPGREHDPNTVGLTLEQIRTALRDAVSLLPAPVHLVEGPEMLRVDEPHLLADGVHPTQEGYRVIGERLTLRMRDIVAPRSE